MATKATAKTKTTKAAMSVETPEAGNGAQGIKDFETIKAPEIVNTLDPRRYAIPVAYGTGGVVQKLMLPVRKPDNRLYVRASANPDEQLALHLVEDKTPGTIGVSYYLVEPEIVPMLAADVRPVLLTRAIDCLMGEFLWLVRLAQDGREPNDWTLSALKVLDVAKSAWIRVLSGRGAYEAQFPDDSLDEPIWSERSMGEMLTVAFADRHIHDLSHPVAARLRGRKLVRG
jgi:hypothetical protein